MWLADVIDSALIWCSYVRTVTIDNHINDLRLECLIDFKIKERQSFGALCFLFLFLSINKFDMRKLFFNVIFNTFGNKARTKVDEFQVFHITTADGQPCKDAITFAIG